MRVVAGPCHEFTEASKTIRRIMGALAVFLLTAAVDPITIEHRELRRQLIFATLARSAMARQTIMTRLTWRLCGLVASREAQHIFRRVRVPAC